MMLYTILLPKNAKQGYKPVPTLYASIMTVQVDTANLVQMDISSTIIQVYVKSSRRNVLQDNIIIQYQISVCTVKKNKSLTM